MWASYIRKYENDHVMKKLKSHYAVPSNCDDFLIPILNEDIFEIRMPIHTTN